MAMLALCRCARVASAHGKIILSAGDNLSEILAIEKGRAKDYSLNCLCRRNGALQLAADMVWRRRHVISEENASDKDSRLVERGLLKPGDIVGGSSLARRLYRAGLKPVGPPRAERRPEVTPTRASDAASNGRCPGPCFLELCACSARLTSATNTCA